MDLCKESKCRLCLSTNITLVNVLNYRQLPKRIEECLNIQIENTDKFPKTVCTSCLRKIENWLSFKSSCLKTQELLKQTESLKNDNEDIKLVDETGSIYTVEEVIKIELDNGDTLINSDLILKFEENDKLDNYNKIEFIENQVDPYQCSLCFNKLDNNKMLLEHVCRDTEINKTIKSKYTLNEIQDEQEQIGFNCTHCTEEYETAEDLKTHIKTAHDKVTCKICNSVMLRSSLKMHMISHTDRFKCSQCSHKFGNRVNLQQHIINVHTDIKNFICEVCSKRFSSKANLNVHMKSHKESRDYECTICDYKGRTASAVYTHMFTHNSERLSCMYCGKLFKGPGRVAAHIKAIHTTVEKKFECTYCSKRFASKYKLTFHERVHTGFRPYECTVCDKGFKRKDSLREHMGVHGLGRGAKCSFCSRPFVNKSIARQHEEKCKTKIKKDDNDL